MHPTIVIGAITILVSGSDPETETRIRDSFERAPECLRGAMDDGELRVLPGKLNAVYGTEDTTSTRSIEEVLGGRAKPGAPNGRLEQYIGIMDRLLVGAERLADEAALEAEVCALPGELEPLFSNLDRVLLHEIAHSFDFDARGGGRRVDVEEFLEIRWRAEYESWAEDPDRIRIHQEYSAAQALIHVRAAAGKEPTPAQLEQVCALRRELDAKYGQMPSRLPGDFHAFSKNDGAEYFAIAIETLAYAPEVFCKSYSAAEIAWLKDVLGECLANLKKRAACYDAMPAADRLSPRKPDGAGIRRD